MWHFLTLTLNTFQIFVHIFVVNDIQSQLMQKMLDLLFSVLCVSHASVHVHSGHFRIIVVNKTSSDKG